MNTLPEVLADLVRAAATLRAGGSSWEVIAAKLGPHATDCSRWPVSYPAEWQRLFREASQRLALEAAGEARAILRALMRSDDEKIRLAAAQQLLKAPAKPAVKPRPKIADDDAAIAAFITELRGYSDDELDRALREASISDEDGASSAAGADGSQ